MVFYVIIALVVIVIVVLILYFIAMFNNFKRLQQKVFQAESGIDVALVKRYDTLTKMMTIVKSYVAHENQLLLEVIKLRKGMSLTEKTQANQCMDQVVEKLNIIVENYPDLRSSRNYLQLNAAVKEAEEHLQAARRLYNANVSAYNQSFIVFPANLVNSLTGNKHMVLDFFQAEESRLSDVKIDL